MGIVGSYFCSSNAITQTLENCPVDVAFMMEVFSPLSSTNIDKEETQAWIYRLRKITTLNGDEYVQLVNSGETAGTFTYGAWTKIAKVTDKVNNAVNADNASYAANAGKLSGTERYTTGHDARNKIMVVGNDGVVEAGKYMDFHSTYNADYSVRLQSPNINDGSGVTATLPSSSGTLAVFSSASSEVSGSIKFPDMNIMICWGFYSGGGNKNVTLPGGVSYKTNTYTIATACGYKESTSNAYGQYTDQTTTGFKLIGGASDSSDCWITIGRYQ